MSGVSRTIYVNIDSPDLGFSYFDFLGEGQLKKNTLYITHVYIIHYMINIWHLINAVGFEVAAASAAVKLSRKIAKPQPWPPSTFKAIQWNMYTCIHICLTYTCIQLFKLIECTFINHAEPKWDWKCRSKINSHKRLQILGPDPQFNPGTISKHFTIRILHI